MAKSSIICEIKITGEKQAESIKAAFAAKAEAKRTEEEYDAAKAEAIDLIKNKIYTTWMAEGQPKFGQYAFKLPDDTTHIITAQNISSKKSFTPVEAKEVISKIGCKGGDILQIVTRHSINEKATKRPKIFNQIKTVLEKLQEELHANGDLAPEETLIITTNDLEIVEHAIPRLMAISESREKFAESLTILKDPVSCSLIS